MEQYTLGTVMRRLYFCFSQGGIWHVAAVRTSPELRPSSSRTTAIFKEIDHERAVEPHISSHALRFAP